MRIQLTRFCSGEFLNLLSDGLRAERLGVSDFSVRIRRGRTLFMPERLGSFGDSKTSGGRKTATKTSSDAAVQCHDIWQ
jgi:hypothetical protein